MNYRLEDMLRYIPDLGIGLLARDPRAYGTDGAIHWKGKAPLSLSLARAPGDEDEMSPRRASVGRARLTRSFSQPDHRVATLGEISNGANIADSTLGSIDRVKLPGLPWLVLLAQKVFLSS